jgi:branched-chain amino acid transport system substrate-binding protein
MLRWLALTVLLVAAPAMAQEGPVRLRIAGGAGFINGAELALREINARGGIAGRQVVTVPSGGDIVLDPKIFADAPAPLARYLVGTLRAKSVAVAARSLDGVAITPLPATALIVEPGQVDFSALVIRAKNSGADALIVSALPSDEAVRLLTELRQQNYDRPVLGEASLVSARLIERAGDAANGVRAVVGLGAETPMPAIRDFQRKHEAIYGGRSGVDAMRGYSAVYIAKAVTAKLGRVDNAAFAQALKALSLSANDEPGLLLDVTGDASGVLRHQLLVVEVRNRQAVAIDTLPPN